MLDPNPMSGQDHKKHVGWVPSSQSLKHNQVFKGQILKPEEPRCVALGIYLSPSPSLNLNFLIYKMRYLINALLMGL